MRNQYYVIENGQVSGPDVDSNSTVRGPFSSKKAAREDILNDAHCCFDVDGHHLGVNDGYGSRSTIVQVIETIIATPTLAVTWKLKRSVSTGQAAAKGADNV